MSTQERRAQETYEAAYNRAARLRRELREGLVSLAGGRTELPEAAVLEGLARLRRELDLLQILLDVDVLR